MYLVWPARLRSEKGDATMQDKLPPAIFIAGCLGLDFLNSIATPVDEIIDWIGDGAGLLSWMKQAGLLTDADIDAVKAGMTSKELDRVAAKARQLREWFRGFTEAHRGRPFKVRALVQLAPLNKLLASDEIFWTLVPGPPASSNRASRQASPAIFQLRPRRRWRKPDSLLSPIAEELAKFITAVDFRNLKACQGKKCTLLFLDQTRGHGRRWCSMGVCGNRAKQEAHVERLKRKSPPGERNR
jgi:predicted RNA-binding Zn ribbon-like protein